MPPRITTIAALIAYLLQTRQLQILPGNLLAQWGPPGRRFLGADFMPPRLLENNADTIDNLSYYTVAAKDGTRSSPAQLVKGGVVFGSIQYALTNSDLARQFTGNDYEGLVRYLQRRETVQAQAAVVGWTDTTLVQALVERDEFKIWARLTTGGFGRFGDNGFVEFIDGPSLSGQYVIVAGDWSDPTYNPWPDIEARIQREVNLGYEKSGIRVVFTDQIRTILKQNPHTAVKAGKSVLVTNSAGQIQTQPITGIVDDADIDAIFRAMGVQAPISYDLRGFSPGHVQKRFFPEGNMLFMGATGRTEEVRYNEDNPEDVQVVNDTVGFLGIGVANAQQTPGRRVEVRPFLNQKDARLEGEAWQTSDPILLEPLAVAGLSGIQ